MASSIDKSGNITLNRAEDFQRTIAFRSKSTGEIIDISGFNIRFIVKASDSAPSTTPALIDIALPVHPEIETAKLLALTEAHAALLGKKTCYWILLYSVGSPGSTKDKVLKSGTITAEGFAV